MHLSKNTDKSLTGFIGKFHSVCIFCCGITNVNMSFACSSYLDILKTSVT